MTGNQIGTPGSGKYLGYVWDGRKWVDPISCKPGKFNPWDRTHWAWRVLFIAIAAGVCLYIGLGVNAVMGN
jgi:hypothetical protein